MCCWCCRRSSLLLLPLLGVAAGWWQKLAKLHSQADTDFLETFSPSIKKISIFGPLRLQLRAQLSSLHDWKHPPQHLCYNVQPYEGGFCWRNYCVGNYKINVIMWDTIIWNLCFSLMMSEKSFSEAFIICTSIIPLFRFFFWSYLVTFFMALLVVIYTDGMNWKLQKWINYHSFIAPHCGPRKGVSSSHDGMYKWW